MLPRRPSLPVTAVLVLGASVALYAFPACSDGDPAATGGGTGGAGGEGGEVIEGLEDVVYEGGATDEALESMLAAEPVTGSDEAPSLTSPGDGTKLDPAGDPPTFEWKNGPIALRDGAGAPAHPFFDGLREFVGPMRAAHAHGAPVNGNAYLLVIGTPSNDHFVRVFTTKTSWTPDAATWEKIGTATEPMNVWVMRGIFDENELAADGGPYQGPWIAIQNEKEGEGT